MHTPTLPNTYTLKTFEKWSKNSQKIIELRTPTYLRHFLLSEILARYLMKKVQINGNNAFNQTAALTVDSC